MTESERALMFSLAEKGNANAQYNLGNCYYDGDGVPKDMEKSSYWYAKAAEQGDRGAQINLGYNYAHGLGVPNDLEKAFYWYAKAAEQGSAVAQCNLGYYYLEGRGVPQDREKALYWLTKSSNQGDATAREALKELKDSMALETLSRAELEKEKAKLEENIDKLEKRNAFIEREIDYLRNYSSMSSKYGRMLDEKEDLKMERFGNDHKLGKLYARLREIEALLAP